MEIRSFHHVEFWVTNALQASFWYCCNFGFEKFAERRSKNWKTNEIAVRNGKVILVFKCPLSPVIEEINQEIAIHGDFVKDVAYTGIENQGGCILERVNIFEDEFGSVKIAKIGGPTGSIIHSLIQNLDYDGIFLPGFVPVENFGISKNLDPIFIESLDHVVENYSEDTTASVADWYNKILNFHRFWSIDDNQVHTSYSALKAQIVSNSSNEVQVTLVEPVSGISNKRGQVQEFLDFHGGPGIQHIAFKVSNITSVVDEMRKRGVIFLDIPDSYYDMLEKRLKSSNFEIEEKLKDVRKLKLLVDFDENGYLLQIFTKPMQDRPSLFVEVIQRHNFNGFGAGNFKALFEAVEEEQKKRGTLIKSS
ncbi:hypothetical protein FO519_004889 [Halicephalobus sp. NKZ332]|nr:hypothetical protein FO519_004889 [Halicephalobus sp. NKZ332]